jgi:hypothetical protein
MPNTGNGRELLEQMPPLESKPFSVLLVAGGLYLVAFLQAWAKLQRKSAPSEGNPC